ncbi:MAG: helix-turn-helix domain-containing protein [Proteobacteria bacterium]|nr:helix-turn-helix domain-containing protein [Pseudomonadota bacterium]MBU4258814.1 helix-turn-helix domain-containing protein [Pseudomonadota bacterium]MBU4287108.1 helix-turn-helix domain-containing protein [Pseudomonadota bacterium]MBU4415186.1 helix-turn-helix domain-containing protein [Pseudomonadota bacterium]MCG2757191.1 helix-turn-helix domain-containing protein [Desulfobacteraceae bacterium]
MNLELKAMVIKKFGSQAEFSMVINEDESTISRVIKGRRRLNDEQKNKWADALGCKPNEIFNELQKEQTLP